MLPRIEFNFQRLPVKPTLAFPKRYSTLLPLIPIRIINRSDKEKYFDLKALLDSGADISILPSEIAESIGLDVENERKQEIRGINGGLVMTYVHDVIIEVGGWKFNSFVSFSTAETVFPVLGREGFFNLFEIKINYSKEIIELKAVVEPLK